MAVLTRLLLVWLSLGEHICFAIADLSDIWYLVDVNAVICPKIDANETNYYLAIAQTSNIKLDSPYIFGFLRKSSEATTITFTVNDANGAEVLPKSTYSLAALSNAVPDSCRCQSVTLPASVATKFGADYGSTCKAWDLTNCASWYGINTVGSWCCSSWCFSSKECPDAYQSELVPGSYYSYAACRTPPPATCEWTMVALQADPCSCRNVGSILALNSTSLLRYTTPSGDPKTYGQACLEWDEFSCGITYTPPPSDKSGCCRAWCYVDEACPTSVQSEDSAQLHWSYTPCVDNATKVMQCPDPIADTFAARASSSDLDLCACNSEEMPADMLPDDAPPGYGKTCAPHDKDICEKVHIGAQTDIWCCQSWCWVNKACPVARESDIWPGHYFSSAYCDSKRIYSVYDLQNCKYNNKVCKCLGQVDSALLPPGVPANYGSECNQWDRTGCAARFSSVLGAQWTSSANQDWCCQKWCYMSELCPLAKTSLLSARLSYSAEICLATNEIYQNSSDACIVPTRVLSSSNPYLGKTVTNAWTSFARRLSSRRRAPPAPPPPSSPRRRAPAPPPPEAPRRRVASMTSSPPRRRVDTMTSSPPRRRITMTSSPPRRRVDTMTSSPPRRRLSDTSPRRRAQVGDSTPPRRRIPVQPSPGSGLIDSRRRTPVGISGTAFDTSRRRGDLIGEDPIFRRRRTPVPYGYASQPTLLSNYGGVAPQTTPYGYSGMNAVRPQQHANIAMYGAAAAAGVGAGALLGAGAMYAYHSQSPGVVRWGDSYRRRRIQPAEFCVIPALGGSRAGDFLECFQCNQRYGNCLSTAGCYNREGCSYMTHASYNRDDLGDTGIIPREWAWPLKVTFHSIAAKDIFPDDVAGSCPPTTLANAIEAEKHNKSMYFGADLFLILTKQEAFPAEGVVGVTGTIRGVGSTLFALPMTILMALRA